MDYLIDTHILLWRIASSPRLPKNVNEEIDNIRNRIWVSKASLWEIAIKLSLKKLELKVPFTELEKYLTKKNISILDFNHSDLNLLLELPLHHRDPFDRLIISQAINRNFTIITDDSQFKNYPVQLL